MENSKAQHDAISRVQTNLDKILQETECALRKSKTNYLESEEEQKLKEKRALAEAGLRRTTSKFEMVNVLLQILHKQEELTVEEYTIDNSTFKVLVIEDTEF